MYKKLGHLKRWEKIAKDIDIGYDNNDYINVTHREKLYNVNTDSFDGKSKHLRCSQVNVYTDGSRLEDKCGSGYVIYKKGKEIFRKSSRLPDTSTVFQAEINGILLASKFLLNEKLTVKPKYIKIFSDSQAALLALNNAEITSKLVHETKQALNLLAQNTRRVNLVWIKAHVGHPGNEVADELAKEATRKEAIDNKIDTPLAVIKDKLEDKYRDKWNKEWHEYKEAKHTKEFYKTCDKSKAKIAIKLPRVTLSRLVKLVTGHGDLAYFYSKIEPDTNPICRFCKERNETFIHLTECPRLRTYQNDCFSGVLISQKWDINSLLAFAGKKEIEQAIDGLDCDLSNLSIFSVSSSEDSFRFSQPEPD